MKYSATFVVECTNQKGETVELYSNDLTVYGTPYYSAPSFSLSNDTLTVICGYYDPYSARSDYKLMVKVLNTQSQEPVIREIPLNSGVTTVENISGGYSVFEMTAYTQYTEEGNVVDPPDSRYDYNSLDSLVTVSNIGRTVVPMVGGVEGHLTITVGVCSEELTAVIRVKDSASGPVDQSVTLVNNTSDSYTFDLLSTVNTNVELDYYVEVFNAINPIRTTGTVVFTYASYVTDSLTTTVLDPSENGPGLEVHFEVNDPYGIWSDYRARVVTTGQTQQGIELCSNARIVDNKVYFDKNVNFENGTADIYITCTQDGNTVDVAVKRTIDVYRGPTINLNGELNPTQGGGYDQSIILYAEFYEFGSSNEPKELYVLLFQDDKSKSSQSFIFNTTDKIYNTTVTFDDITIDFTPAEPINVRIYEKKGDEQILIAICDDTTQYYV